MSLSLVEEDQTVPSCCSTSLPGGENNFEVGVIILAEITSFFVELS